MRGGIPFIGKPHRSDGETGTIGEAFEFFLSEWGLAPDYIVGNWTEELLNLMAEKMLDRKRKLAEALDQGKVGKPLDFNRRVSDEQLFAQLGKKLRVVR